MNESARNRESARFFSTHCNTPVVRRSVTLACATEAPQEHRMASTAEKTGLDVLRDDACRAKLFAVTYSQHRKCTECTDCRSLRQRHSKNCLFMTSFCTLECKVAAIFRGRNDACLQHDGLSTHTSVAFKFGNAMPFIDELCSN